MLDYRNDKLGLHSLISEYPFIVLSSKTGAQLQTLHQKAIQAGIVHNVFLSSMLGSSAEDQLNKTANATEATAEYMVVVLFGDSVAIDPLTKRFSLFSNPPSSSSAPEESGEHENQ